MAQPRVILADDHPAIRQLTCDLLQAECEVVDAVSDGAAAVASAARLGPDVAVLDISMPGLTGFETARQLLALPRSPRIVFLTLHDDPEVVTEVRAMGGCSFVLKNRMVLDLLRAIRLTLLGTPFISPCAEETVAVRASRFINEARSASA